jgi:ketosteroid isomerase-like protein
VGEAEVELVRNISDLWDRREYASAAEFVDPDVEFARIGAEFADLAGEWRGAPQMWAAIVEYFRAWDDLRQRTERFIDLGDRVLALATQIGRGRVSGLVVEREVAFLFTVRDGKIVRLVGYWDRAEAMRAAGLEP